jgi:predicted GNAT superfamily acetyltransferase
MSVLPVSVDVLDAALALNSAHAVELSWLDRDRLTVLVDRAFHAALGFVEVGRARREKADKTVRYLMRTR